MNYLTDKKFSFESKSEDKETFGVVSFTGSEGLSRLYQFDITLVADSADIDMDGIIEKPASFFIHRPDGSKVPFHGIIAEFDMIQAVGSCFLYRVLLVPKLWRLTLTHHNQIFLKATPEDIITQVLKDGGLTTLDFEFRLNGSYVTWEYACQYGESHYSFICRWMEQNGIYFFFDQSGDSEKLIMTDSKMSHVATSFGTDLTYAPVSGLEAMHLDEAIQSYICRRQQVPKNVILQDYNYRKPSLDVQGKAEVCPTGHGELYFYGDHFRTPEEGNKLAKIRSEEFLCKEKEFHGESTVPYLMPGYTFSLDKHFNDKMNRKYLTISMQHQGNQASFLVSGIQEHLSGIELESSYRNSFTAIESDVQFRPERITERPRLHGTLSGRIDAAGSGKYAEVDEHGRYKVILPFDRSGRGGGKASTWIRMMQPYGGSDHGMHFPLHKGCEVLLTFIDGNPDRPVIAGSVANPDHPSQITSDTQTMSKLTTSGGNKIHIEDKEGSERILLHSPTSDTWVRMGAPNDPPSFEDEFHKTTEKESGYSIHSDGWFTGKYGFGKMEFIGGLKQEVVAGNDFKTVLGFEEKINVVGKFDLVIGGEVGVKVGGSKDFKILHWEFKPTSLVAHGDKTEINEAKTELRGEINTLSGVVTALDGETTKLAGETKSLAGETTNLAGKVTRLAGETSTLAGTTEQLCGRLQYAGVISAINFGEESKAIGARTAVIGEETAAVGEQTTTIGEKITVAGEEDNLIGFQVTV